MRIAATYDARDRLVRFGNVEYAYTPNGERQRKKDPSGTTFYEYDVFGNLVRVELPNGKRIDYIVDTAGRRIAKKVNGTFTRRWLYRDSRKPIAEFDGDDISRAHGRSMISPPARPARPPCARRAGVVCR